MVGDDFQQLLLGFSPDHEIAIGPCISAADLSVDFASHDQNPLSISHLDTTFFRPLRAFVFLDENLFLWMLGVFRIIGPERILREGSIMDLRISMPGASSYLCPFPTPGAG